MLSVISTTQEELLLLVWNLDLITIEVKLVMSMMANVPFRCSMFESLTHDVKTKKEMNQFYFFGIEKEDGYKPF